MTTLFKNFGNAFLPSALALQIWRRNFMVWRKTATASLAGTLGEPLLFLLGMGYGLGSFIGVMEGVSYLVFIAAGILAANSMNAATFEALYGAFTRMTRQNTYQAMLATPVRVSDIVAGEILWAASKALLSGCAILVVGVGLGAFSMQAIWAVPVVFLSGLVFAGLGMVVTAISPSYEFFQYYTTLVTTPMFLFCGVFFPVSALPGAVHWVLNLLPLTHVVALMRGATQGDMGAGAGVSVLVLVVYAVGAFLLATHLIRKRIIV